MPHHDEYDSKTSQSKRFTPAELIAYRGRLYERVSESLDDDVPAPHAVQAANAPEASPAANARQEACIELERDAGFLVERLTSHARLEPDEQMLWATIKRFEENIGLVRRDQRLTQAIRDFAHQGKIILSDKGMFDRPPRERLAELKELRDYFDAFVVEIDRFGSGGQQPPVGTSISRADTAPFFSLVSGSFSAGVMDFHVRNDGQPVTVLAFDTSTSGCHIRQWYPTSLPTNEVLRAAVDLAHPEPRSCVFRLRIRDRAGTERLYELRLDRDSSPQRFDFVEL